MKNVLTALACLISVSLSAQEQVITYPYNPDADTDSLIAVPDMLDLLVLFGNEFIPEPVMVDGVYITEWLESASNQCCDSLSSVIDSIQVVLESNSGSGGGCYSFGNPTNVITENLNWQPGSWPETYFEEAQEDGFYGGQMNCGSSYNGTFQVWDDTTSNSSLYNYNISNGVATFLIPIKAGQYWKISGTCIDVNFFIPLDCSGGGSSEGEGGSSDVVVSIIGDTLTQNGISLIVPGISYNNTPDEIFSTVTDIDGNIYQTVDYGFACWMTENLYTTRYSNGDNIIYPANSSEPSYNSTDVFISDFGHSTLYYNYLAVNDPRNICPSGWHVPTSDEWAEILSVFGSEFETGNLYGSFWQNAAPALKSNDPYGPNWNNNETTNYSHLNIYRLGWATDLEIVASGANGAKMMTSTYTNFVPAGNFIIDLDNSSYDNDVEIDTSDYGFYGVRCVKD